MKQAKRGPKGKKKTAGARARKSSSRKASKAGKKTGKGARRVSTKVSKKARRTIRKKTARKRVSGKKSARKKPVGKSGARAKKVESSGKPRSQVVAVGKPTPKGLKVGTGGSGSRAEKLRAMLETKRAEILEEIRRARQDSMESDRMSFPEVGDLVSASVEKEKAFEYGEIGVNALREIGDALGKLKEGTYGICEMCSKPIGVKRLQVMPSARLCIKCKSKEEASGPFSRGRSDT